MKMTTATEILLAADTGGSKTDWLLVTPDGMRVDRCVTPGLASLRAGMLPVEPSVRQTAARWSRVRPAHLYCSCGGPNTEEIRGALERAWPETPVTVEREASGALLLACREFLRCDGAVLAGTGVTAVGFTPDGRCRYADGWGPVYGDSGSGGGIGLKAVRRFLQGVDGTAEAGRLGELFRDAAAGVNTAEFDGRMELKRRINELDRRALAALAPRVAALAEEGDPAASGILDNAARHMAQLAAAVAPDGGTVLMLGGLFKLGGDFRRRCEDFLRERNPGCRWFRDERVTIGKLAAARAMQLAGHVVNARRWSNLLNERTA